MSPTAPLTPQFFGHESCVKTPPAHKRVAIPELVKALRQNCVDRVHNALEANPDAIWCPPLDYSVDPLLCVAIGLGCNPEIIKLLLDRGADVFARNTRGHTPLSLLKARSRQTAQDHQQISEIALMLERAMRNTCSWHTVGEQECAVKFEGEDTNHFGQVVLTAMDVHTAWCAKDAHSCFAPTFPMFPPVPDIPKLNRHETFDLYDDKGVKDVGRVTSAPSVTRDAWCAKGDYFVFAETAPLFPPVFEFSKPDLHEKLDGLLFDALNL